MSASVASAGLVYSSTSDTRLERPALPRILSRHGAQAFHVVERIKTRLRRMKHGTITASRLINEAMGRGGFRFRAAMVTLTYAPGHTWEPQHLSATLKAARQWHQRLGIRMRYVWVAEMQERGAVHYHLIFWLPRGYKLPLFDRRGWWPYGSSNAEWARNAVGYLAKYASKGDEGAAFPRGIRISGCGGLEPEGRRVMRYWRAPAECRECLGEAADIRRIKGGRFDAVTGLFWDSPWRFLFINGDPHLTKAQLEA
jgi:hypothetical protein